ncbi:repetitive organellar protein-like [Palaemon carinicauda]|uniref:repetitive organellar protein-like n=1 Tax=Palaemon carinicauda TaxID=392227 RepID=UPI0035B65E17
MDELFTEMSVILGPDENKVDGFVHILDDRDLYRKSVNIVNGCDKEEVIDKVYEGPVTWTNTSENEITIEDAIETPVAKSINLRPRKAHPPLSSLDNPSWEFLHSNYTKGELQKYCSQLDLGGIWTTKEKLIDKILLHYSSVNGQPSSSYTSSTENSHTSGNADTNLTELIQKFDKFVREMNDNFYVVNNNLAEKEVEINELKTKLLLAEERVEALEVALRRKDKSHEEGGNVFPEKNILLIGDSCLQGIKSEDLDDHVIVRTLQEANVDLIKSWITEKLSYPIKECIIYCGVQDVLDEDTTMEGITDCLGTLVAELKNKNENTVVKGKDSNQTNRTTLRNQSRLKVENRDPPYSQINFNARHRFPDTRIYNRGHGDHHRENNYRLQNREAHYYSAETGIELNKLKVEIELSELKLELELNKLKVEIELTKLKLELELNKLKVEIELSELKLELELNKLKVEIELSQLKLELELNKLKLENKLNELKLDLELNQLKLENKLNQLKMDLELNQLKLEGDLNQLKLELDLNQMELELKLNQMKMKIELNQLKLELDINKLELEIKLNQLKLLKLEGDLNQLKLELDLNQMELELKLNQMKMKIELNQLKLELELNQLNRNLR